MVRNIHQVKLRGLARGQRAMVAVHKLASHFPLQGGTTLADSQNQLHGRCHLGM